MRDVLIIGGSFAGLAVANQLRGFRVSILDPKPIGSQQTSACGTPLPVLEHWGMTDSVLQVHDRLVLHTARRTIEYPSPFEWCTFDYKKLCSDLFTQSGAEFIQEAATGYREGWVHTRQGKYTAACIVDASGWKASIASSIKPHFHRPGNNSFGLETILPTNSYNDLRGLHFWYDRSVLKHGVGWAFPRGESASFGIGSYQGRSRLKGPLQKLLDPLKLNIEKLHGTQIPSELRHAVAGPVFVVGDAAGMCIGLTAEGIRPAMYFGEVCGRIIRQVLEGKLSLRSGLAKYAASVERKRMFFDFFSALQSFLTRLPPMWVDWIARVIEQERIRSWAFDRYWNFTKEWGIAIHDEPAPTEHSLTGYAPKSMKPVKYSSYLRQQ